MQPVILDTDVASLSHKRKLADPLTTRLIGLTGSYQVRAEQNNKEDVPSGQSRSGMLYVDHVSRDDVVDPGSPTPAYRQLEAILRRRIEAGEWRTGPLPSVAYLQHEYGVGRDTVLHALRLLREAGLIFTVPKRGSYVASRGS